MLLSSHHSGMDDHLHLKWGIRSLASVGCWPLKFQNKLFSILYSVHFVLVMTIYILVLVGEFIELYMVMRRDLEELSMLLGLFLLHALSIAKLGILRGETIEKLKQKLFAYEKYILNCDDENIKQIYMKHVEMNHRANKIMIFIGVLCFILYTLSPYFTDELSNKGPFYEIIDNTTIIYKPRSLPLISWFPFDRYKYYWVSYGWHVIALSIIPPFVVGVVNFLHGLITFAIGQLKILQYNLTNFTKIKGNLKNNQLESDAAENLRNCILHHKDIITYVKDLSNSMRMYLLFDFLGCGLQIAVVGFQAAVMDVSPNLVKTLWYLASILTQLFLFYWFANGILLESVNVSNAIWNSKWYSCNESTKRTLHIVMMRAQKPITLSIGSFYVTSTETLVALLRVGYSYAMLMRRVYKK